MYLLFTGSCIIQGLCCSLSCKYEHFLPKNICTLIYWITWDKKILILEKVAKIHWTITVSLNFIQWSNSLNPNQTRISALKVTLCGTSPQEKQ